MSLTMWTLISFNIILKDSHDLYKWQQDHQPAPPRSASFSHLPMDRTTMLDSSLVHIREPGGFRRNFVVNRAQEQGLEPPSVVRNVVDFLFLYGHFVSCLRLPSRHLYLYRTTSRTMGRN